MSAPTGGGAGPTGPTLPTGPVAARRVLVVHPSAELYGSDRVVLETAVALRDDRRDVLVALACDGPLVGELEALGVPVVVMPVPVLRKSLMSIRGLAGFAAQTVRTVAPMWRLLRSHRPDVVYVNTVTVPSWSLMARLARVPVLCHVHEAEEALPRLLRVLLAMPALLARSVVANSEVSRAVLVRDLPALSRRTTVVYNGVPGPERATSPRAELSDPVRLVLVGRVSPRKGTDVAVEALALLREQGIDADLTLVGGVFPGYEWFEQEVRELARARGVEPAVHWAGVLGHVWDALAAADVALVPSRVEPFGNAAVEALLAGRPLVVGDTQGLREIVHTGVEGELAAPGDAAALAGAVRKIIDDWSGAVERAGLAERDVRARFDPLRYRADIVAALDAAVRRRRPGGTPDAPPPATAGRPS